MSFPAALLLTLAVEVPLYAAALIALRLCRPALAVATAAGVNLLTHPALWWLLAPQPSVARVAAAELAVWVAETALLWLVVRRRPGVLAVVSAGANAASVLAGLAVNAAV